MRHMRARAHTPSHMCSYIERRVIDFDVSPVFLGGVIYKRVPASKGIAGDCTVLPETDAGLTDRVLRDLERCISDQRRT
jgi:hypothetical protein